MNTHAFAPSSWSTAAFGDASESAPMELSALSEHLGQCHGARGRLFGLHCAAETAHRFMLARLVTTTVVAALVIGVACSFT